MGWFWADSYPLTAAAPPQVTGPSAVAPPPGCPMHVKDSSTSAPLQHDHNGSSRSGQSLCPVRPSNSPFHVAAQSSNFPSQTTTPSKSEIASQSSRPSSLSRLNPLNYMFASISQERAPNQTVDLPVDREISSIPRGDTAAGNWEYPSPQQMYNAMLRKGYTDTPQDAVESMVAVHNFLNEGAWSEIEEWEQIFSKGLRSGWEKCRRGSENLSRQLEIERRTGQVDQESKPRLTRFQGRPQEPTPKARILQALGWVYPAKFSSDPPFDRHDWYVCRQTPSGPKEVRYVIDYYSAPPEESGEPVFYLDIRPAVDSPTAAVERLMRWGGDVWWRASGGDVRKSR